MVKVTTISDNCTKLIEYFECGGNVSKYLNSYKCPAGVWTIGIGTTVYPNGLKVKEGEKITIAQAYDYLKHDLKFTMQMVDSYTTDAVNQSQFDSLISFAYNLGVYALKGSTLLKKVNINPNDPAIQKEFEKWVYAGGKILPGLVKRRKSEAYLYYYGNNNFNF